MTTFAELEALVIAQTRRPEVTNITQAAIKSATLRAHHTDFFPRDLLPTQRTIGPIIAKDDELIGVFGLERGYCLMIGGPSDAVDRLTPIFETLAPGIGTAARTPGRSDVEAPEEHGWLHCGPSGAGHFVKMVHNGIEYGLMAAYAEGLNVLAKANIGAVDHPVDAETAPLDAAHYYRYDLDLAKITEVWRRGSVVSSWLIDLTAEAFHADPELNAYAGVVSDSGEGRWTINAAIDEGVPVAVLSAALYQRFSSRGRSDVADQVLSAMRAGFGGHIERTDTTR